MGNEVDIEDGICQVSEGAIGIVRGVQGAVVGVAALRQSLAEIVVEDAQGLPGLVLWEQ